MKLAEAVAELIPFDDLGEAVSAVEFAPFLLRRHHQKGTVENTNNRLRKYLPRSTEPSPLSLRPMALPMATADKSIFEVDLPPPQSNSAQMPGLPDACGSF